VNDGAMSDGPVNEASFGASIQKVVVEPLQVLGESIVSALPSVFQALLAVAIGYLAAAVARRLVKHALRAIGVDVIYRRLTGREHLAGEGLVGGPSDFGGLAVYWAVMLSAALYALQVLGLSEAAVLLYRLVNYLPMILVSIAIATIGLYAADLFGRVVTAAADSAKLPMPRWWGLGIQYGIIGFTAVAILEYLQIGAASAVVIAAAVASVVPVAAAIAFGWGARRQAEELITGRAYRTHLAPGDTVAFQLDGERIEGTVEELGATVLRVRTTEGTCLVPYTALARTKTLVRTPKD